MPRGKSGQTPEKLERALSLLRQSEAGILDELECPDCRNRSVSVWFTNPAEGQFRQWFVCERCKFDSRVVCLEKPTIYAESRVHHQLELYDKNLLSKMTVYRPPAKGDGASESQGT